MKIYANTIVHNEENFIWFALMSVVDYVDKILVWDSGSTDKTVQIIKEVIKVKGEKIEFKEVGQVDKYEFTKMRQKMLEESHCDWILVLDGDEVWWNSSIKKIINTIDEEGDEIEGIVVPMMVSVGDIFHFQDESAGQYQLLGRKGHLSLKVINRKIPSLHVDWPYGKESYLDQGNNPIQERSKIVFINTPLLHVTHLKRSNLKKVSEKFKHEVGNLVKKDFVFPEVLYKSYPEIVPSPWTKMSGMDLVIAKLLTPARKIKRRLS